MRARLALAVVSLLAVAAGCSDDPLPSAPRQITPPSATVYAASVSGPSVLGTYLGSTYNIAYGINDAGDIVGVSGDDQYAILWATGAGVGPSSVLANTVAGPTATARDINASGQVVGWLGAHAMLWTSSGPVDIGQQIQDHWGAVTSQAHAVNANGWVTGTYDLQPNPPATITRCFLWVPTSPNALTGNITDLGDLGGGWCYAQDVNSLGVVTGGSLTVPNDYNSRHAFVWPNASGIVDIAPSGGASEGIAINDAGQVTGWKTVAAGFMAAVWTPSNLGSWFVTELGAPQLTGQSAGPMQSMALDINDAGFVVGFTRDLNYVDKGFFWQNGVFNELPDPSGVVSEPTALTNLLNDVVIVAGGNVLNIATNSRQALRWGVTLTPVSPLGCVADLVALVQQMQRAGTLRAGEARSLLAKLDATARQIGQRNTTPARNLLNAFINEVNGMVASGRLSSADAQPLIDGAMCAIRAL